MLRTVVLVAIAHLMLADETYGCHDYRHGRPVDSAPSRTKRQIASFGDPAKREAQATRKLRKYFSVCMEGKLGSIWGWNSVLDYTILDTFWYKNSADSNCSKEDNTDSADCWKIRLTSLLEGSSSLLEAASNCIDEYSQSTPNQRYRRQADSPGLAANEFCRPPSNEPFRPNSPKVKSYSLCGETEGNLPSYRPPLDFPSVLEFVGDHTACGSELADCDASNQETLSVGDPDAPKWPYRFEAITRNDSPFKPIIRSCNAKVYPLSTGTWGAWSDCSVTCGGGTRSRTRQCNGAKQCQGNEQESCNQELCENCQISFTTRKPCGSGSGSQQQCASLGCCFSNGLCYKSTKPPSFDPPDFQATASSGLSFGGEDGFPGTRLTRECSLSQPCSRPVSGQDRLSCQKAGCCWIANRCAGYSWKIASLRSDCPPGFSNPPSCRDINECSSNPCTPPMICNDLINSYSCSCPPGTIPPNCYPGLTWSPWSQWSPCSVTCRSGSRTRTRICYSGDCPGLSMESRMCILAPCGIDFCTSPLQNDCHQYAVCSNIPVGSFTCRCLTGFQGDGKVCTDINECSSSTTNNCHPDANCGNIVGSFTCTCKPGFVGDGITCTSIALCTGIVCGPGSTCSLVGGSPTCICVSGYQLTGAVCSDINECAIGADLCLSYSTCANTIGSYTCPCDFGFTGDGLIACTDVNECTSLTAGCDPDADCHNTAGSYTCTCKSGFTGGGFVCHADCTTPPPFSSGVVLDPSYPSGTTFVYVCLRTCQDVVGGPSTTCTDGVWSQPSSPPSCITISVCNLPVIEFGSFTPSYSEGYCVGEQIDITCNPTYMMSGSNFANCQFGGTWTSLPLCVPIPACENLPTIFANGFNVPSGTRHAPGVTVTYMCNSPYSLVDGPSTNTCRPGDVPMWTSLVAPSCQI